MAESTLNSLSTAFGIAKCSARAVDSKSFTINPTASRVGCMVWEARNEQNFDHSPSHCTSLRNERFCKS